MLYRNAALWGLPTELAVVLFRTVPTIATVASEALGGHRILEWQGRRASNASVPTNAMRSCIQLHAHTCKVLMKLARGVEGESAHHMALEGLTCAQAGLQRWEHWRPGRIPDQSSAASCRSLAQARSCTAPAQMMSALHGQCQSFTQATTEDALSEVRSLLTRVIWTPETIHANLRDCTRYHICRRGSR